MVGKHYAWHKRWTVDLSACTATHDSGLIVSFVEADDAKGVWDGTPVNAEAWFAGMKGTMSPGDLANHASRLLREAGDVYLYQLKRH